MLIQQNEFQNPNGSSQFRYSRSKFRNNLVIALALTAMVCAFTWLILGISGSPRLYLYSSVVGLVFFAFMSVTMLRQYIGDTVVLAIRPTGLYDARWSSEIIDWDRIKQINLGQREYQFILSVWLWPQKSTNVTPLHNRPVPAQSSKPDFTIDLEPLDGDPSHIVSLINQHKPVTMDNLQG